MGADLGLFGKSDHTPSRLASGEQAEDPRELRQERKTCAGMHSAMPRQRHHDLTPKQEAFVGEYLVDLNATAAYKRAGYNVANDNVAGVEAHRLLRNPKIAARVNDALTARSQRVQAKADEVLREVLALAYSDIGDILDFSSEEISLRSANLIPKRARKCIVTYKVKRARVRGSDSRHELESVEVKMCNKLAALEKLMRHLGMFRNAPELEDLLARLDGIDPGLGEYVRRRVATLQQQREAPDSKGNGHHACREPAEGVRASAGSAKPYRGRRRPNRHGSARSGRRLYALTEAPAGRPG
jgi:phage terminase small subunit